METKKVIFSTEQVAKNFQLWEFFIASNPNHEFNIPVPLIEAAQIIRDWVGFQTKIQSTSRPNDPPFGQHRFDKAIDLVTPYVIHGATAPKTPEQIFAAFKTECLNYIAGKGSSLIESLRKIGINGLGVECNCIHLDIRPDNPYNRKDAYGSYCVFEFKMDMNGKILINRAL